MRRWMRGAFAALSATATASAALAQGDFPNRSIRLLVGFPPGGSTDVLARTLAQEARGGLEDGLVGPPFLARFGGESHVFLQTRSTMVAIPCPPPMHIVMSAVALPLRSSSSIAVPRSIAPVAPRG